jgi:hypothetical protein
MLSAARLAQINSAPRQSNEPAARLGGMSRSAHQLNANVARPSGMLIQKSRRQSSNARISTPP